MTIPEELRGALRNLRAVRAQRPQGGEDTGEFAAWREEIAEALDLLAGLLIYEQDRVQASEEAAAARAEAGRIGRSQ